MSEPTNKLREWNCAFNPETGELDYHYRHGCTDGFEYITVREVSPTHDAAVEGLLVALERIATVKTVGYTEARKARKVAQDALVAYEASKGRSNVDSKI